MHVRGFCWKVRLLWIEVKDTAWRVGEQCSAKSAANLRIEDIRGTHWEFFEFLSSRGSLMSARTELRSLPINKSNGTVWFLLLISVRRKENTRSVWMPDFRKKKLQEVEKQILDCHEIHRALLSIIRVYSNLLLPLQLWPEYETLWPFLTCQTAHQLKGLRV